MACDSQTLETLSGIDGLARLSERGVLLALAGVYGSSTTAQQAVTLAAANKFASLSDRQLDEVLLVVICTGGGCVAPGAITLATTGGSGSITFTIGLPIPTPTNGYFIKWGTANGGPYPNTKTGSPTALTVVADGLVVGATYYMVAVSDNGGGCVGTPSSQASAAPTP